MAERGRRVGVADREANRARWRKALEAWRGSGLTLAAWAREHGVSRDALQYWKDKFEVAPRPGYGKLTLIPVAAAMPGDTQRAKPAPRNADVPIELHVGDRRLILAPGFDAQSLRIVLDVLGAPC